jgi:hypothetical protein
MVDVRHDLASFALEVDPADFIPSVLHLATRNRGFCVKFIVRTTGSGSARGTVRRPFVWRVGGSVEI